MTTAKKRQQNQPKAKRGVFESIGAIQLGLVVACAAILLNFLIVVMLFHLDLSRYLGFLFPV